MKWWAIPIAVAVGLGLALLWRRNPWTQIAKEFEAADIAAKVKRDTAKRGAVIAQRQVNAHYAETIRKLDEAQVEKANKLRGDPVALSRWLARISE